MNSNTDFYFILLKFFYVVVFAFLQDESFNGFKIIILVVFSTLCFTKYYFLRPYFNHLLNNVSLAFNDAR